MIGWLAQYDTGCLVGDLVAGVTTALTVIPQGIGYAPLAGLPLQVNYKKIKKISKIRYKKFIGKCFHKNIWCFCPMVTSFGKYCRIYCLF